VAGQYLKALEKSKETLNSFSRSYIYNVLLVKQWLIVIPRASKGCDGVIANSARMMGMVWLRSKEERDGWTKFEMSKHLAYLGIIPNQANSTS